eukprot:CAMPEP_0194146454 /NCGR_PEP_ID=MMETSP0152-20130528/20601_1 /TAXON_ID=1049557 /ORGANISM="Thalassiothrix antarctica, Strain L6-D1" /LENGTH=469 /DNA_ID=CAMNT_0038846979 /DNA_START=152 /DNA_END=1561 /DNA_ORIENTATION=+
MYSSTSSTVLLLLLSSLLLSAVHANKRNFKALSTDNCMGYDHLGYIYTYGCDHEYAHAFERVGPNLIAAEGPMSGKCLDNQFDYWPILKDCDPTEPDSQRWTFQDDGQWTVYLNGDTSVEYCLKFISPTVRVKIDKSSDSGDCIQWYDPATGTLGDPIIMGLQGQQFKFDGRDDAWYANLAVHGTPDSKDIFPTSLFQWNMKFKQFPTCPDGEDMFVSSLAYDFGNNKTVLIATTPETIPQCEDEVCLGDGTLHISFDGGKTFVSNPGDYSFGVGNHRLVSHNTYDACSRKWFDFDVSERRNKDNKKNIRGENIRSLKTDFKKPSLQYLTEQKKSTIRPAECENWIQDRFHNNDLFLQKGEWSTIHIETPDTVSLHIEYRRNNLQREVEGQCNFQSLDAWMTRVSKEIHDEEWNGILGETRVRKNHHHSDEDRFTILRGENDADYELDGPFETDFPALHILPSGIKEKE